MIISSQISRKYIKSVLNIRYISLYNFLKRQHFLSINQISGVKPKGFSYNKEKKARILTLFVVKLGFCQVAEVGQPICSVPNSARMLPADAQPQFGPTPLNERKGKRRQN